MKFSSNKDFYIKYEQIRNRKLHFLYSEWRIIVSVWNKFPEQIT